MADAAATGPMFKGELSGTHPAKLIFNLSKKEKSGILLFDDGVTKARLYLKQGRIVDYFDGIKKEKTFRRYLISNSKATTEEFKIARKLSKEQRRNTIEIMIDKGILNRFEVVKDASDFYWKSVPGVFAWRHGTFSFTENDLSSHVEIPTMDNTLQLITSGIREKYNPKMIQQRLKNRMSTKTKPGANPPFPIEMLGLSESQMKFAQMLLDGETIHIALGETDLAHSEALALAFALLTLGLVKFKASAKKKAKKKSKRMTKIEQAMAEASDSVDKIKERIAEEEEASVDLTDVLAASAGGNSENELQSKLEEMYDLKAKRAGLEQMTAGHMDETEMDSEYVEGGEEIGDLEAELGDFADADSEYEGEGEEYTDEGEYADDDGEYAEGEEYGEVEDDFGFGDLDIDESAGEDDAFEGMGSFDQEPEDLVFNPDDSPKDIYKLGITYEDQGAYAVAAKAFDEAISRGFDSPEVQARKAWSVYMDNAETGGFDDAAAILQGVIKNQADSHFPYLYLGKIYEAESDISMAELYYIKALEINRDCEEAKNNIKRLFEDK